MGLLLWTSSILFILSLCSLSLFHSMTEQEALSSYIDKEVSSADRNSGVDFLLKMRRAFYSKSKQAIPAPESVAKDSRLRKKPRLTSKVHLTPAAFIALKSSTGSNTATNSTEQLLRKLLLVLYKDIGLLLKTSDQEAITKILNALAEVMSHYEGKYPTSQAKILANFELGDPTLQECWWYVIHGRKKEKSYWPSLLSFISFQQNRSLVSLWLAPRPILVAIFEEEKIVEEIVEKRTSISKALRKSKESEQMASLEAEFQALCEKNCPSWISPGVLDFKISKTVPPL